MIGHRRKRSNVWNLMILIGRGLDYSKLERESAGQARCLSKEINGKEQQGQRDESGHCAVVRVRKRRRSDVKREEQRSCGTRRKDGRKGAQPKREGRERAGTGRGRRSGTRPIRSASRDIKSHTISFTISGGNDEGVPPVPIPNTEVKPFSAESTWLDTAREHRSPPESFIPQ